MPLTAKDNGPELKPGDYVKMEWVISRVFLDQDVVMVIRPGTGGRSAASPQVVTVRIGTGKTSLKLLPTGAPLAPGTRCLLLWRIAQVYPSTGTVLVARTGIGGSIDIPAAITCTAGALAAELEYVPPEDVKAPLLLTRSDVPYGLERAVDREAATDDMLPYTFEWGDYDWSATVDPPPVLVALEPDRVLAGSPNFTLRAIGEAFTVASTILWDGVALATTFVSPTELTAPINMGPIGADSIAVTVRNGDGAQSAPLTFLVTPP
jgi:hypothetical protein